MKLNIKDLYETLLVACVLGVYFINSKGISIPLLTNTRWAILAIAIIGVAMCAISGSNMPSLSGQGIITKVLMALGIALFVVIIYGLISGAKPILMAIVAIILVMWGITTTKHFLGI